MQKLMDILKKPLVIEKRPNFLRFLAHCKQYISGGTLPWFTRGDLDGFFGLFIDNLLQLMLVGGLCKLFCGFPTEFITGQILPGAALSILIGNLFYAWQARRLAIQTGRGDVTALPFGINTPSLIAFIFLVIAPVYQDTHDYHLAWQVGLFACVLNGLMEIGGAFVGDWLRQNTPRAALLCALAGVAITFIAMGFTFQIFASPLVGFFPMMLILISYGSRVKWPWSLPGGFVAVVLGTLLAWTFHGIFKIPLNISTDPIAWGFYPPHAVPKDLVALMFSSSGWKYLAVIFPMGLFNVIGSLQNLESAEAGGDRYPTKSSLLTNGIATLAAGFFGSAFPTTIYIGHPGWKAMGARHGYSILNGVIITLLCLFGGHPLPEGHSAGMHFGNITLDRHHYHGSGLPGNSQGTLSGRCLRAHPSLRGFCHGRGDPALVDGGRYQPLRGRGQLRDPKKPLYPRGHRPEPGVLAHLHDFRRHIGLCHRP